MKANNSKAIRERGWNPLNRNLLKHPDVLATKEFAPPSTASTNNQSNTERNSNESVASNVASRATTNNPSTGNQNTNQPINSNESQLERSAESDLAPTLNLANGFAGEVLADIIQYGMKQTAVQKNLSQRSFQKK